MSVEHSPYWEKMKGCSSGCAEAGSDFMVQCYDCCASQQYLPHGLLRHKTYGLRHDAATSGPKPKIHKFQRARAVV